MILLYSLARKFLIYNHFAETIIQGTLSDYYCYINAWKKRRQCQNNVILALSCVYLRHPLVRHYALSRSGSEDPEVRSRRRLSSARVVYGSREKKCR